MSVEHHVVFDNDYFYFSGMRFSVGCTLRDGMKAMENGAAVEKLVKAGAIPILVSNTPELCCSIETYNFITGRTNNPYNRFRTSGGSSGGEVNTPKDIYLQYFLHSTKLIGILCVKN